MIRGKDKVGYKNGSEGGFLGTYEQGCSAPGVLREIAADANNLAAVLGEISDAHDDDHNLSQPNISSHVT